MVCCPVEDVRGGMALGDWRKTLLELELEGVGILLLDVGAWGGDVVLGKRSNGQSKGAPFSCWLDGWVGSWLVVLARNVGNEARQKEVGDQYEYV